MGAEGAAVMKIAKAGYAYTIGTGGSAVVELLQG